MMKKLKHIGTLRMKILRHYSWRETKMRL
jgi:hypothetical protein